MKLESPENSIEFISRNPREFLERSFESSSMPLQVFKPTGEPIRSNSAFQRMFGSLQGFPTQLGAVQKVRYFPIKPKEGEVKSILAVYEDSASDWAYQARLQRSEYMLKNAQLAANIGSWITAISDGELVMLSEAGCRLFGLPAMADGTDRVVQSYSIIDPEDRKAVREARRRVVATDLPEGVEYRISVKGETRWIHEQVEMASNASTGKSELLMGFVQDVTQKKLSEKRLRISEARFGRLFNYEGFGVFTTDDSGRIFEANQAFLDICGFDHEDLLEGRVAWKSMTPEEHQEATARALRELRETGSFRPYEKEYVRKDGTRIWVMVGGARVENEGSEIICFALDLTDAKKLEGQLRQAQKMEAIGRLAGGIAHDFNNLLGVILLNAEQALSDPEAPETVDDLKLIQSTAERASRLTRQLLAFSRQQVFELRKVELSGVVADLEKMLQRLIGENIKFTTRLESKLPHVLADQSQIEQVILNLVVNSRDAITGSGRIEVSTEIAQLSAHEIQRRGLSVEPGQYVLLKVEDSGKGMDPSTIGRIFEPFFTTKERGSGTGLGLSTVFGIVKQCGGDVKVESVPMKGTCFEVFFRAYEGAIVALPDAVAVAAKVMSSCAGQRILLVEDEVVLRKMTARVLKKRGYEVLEAGDGLDAMRIYCDNPGSIDLVITDIVMPEMTGPEFVEAIQDHSAIAPPRVLFLSGYSAGELANHGFRDDGRSFMEKPFTSEALLKKVQQTLDPGATA